MIMLSAAAEGRLVSVHPDLVRVVRTAQRTSPMAFTISEGLRSVANEKADVAQGHSQTMHSRHLLAPDGWVYAVDIEPMIDRNGDGVLTISWAWPDYHKFAAIMKACAANETVTIEWGGDWHTLKDGPHWQLPWAQYPGTKEISHEV